MLNRGLKRDDDTKFGAKAAPVHISATVHRKLSAGIILQFQSIVSWMRYVCMQYGYLGVLAISLAGAMSIIVPVPDTIVVFTLAGLKVGASWVFDPLLLASAVAIGGAIGEFSGYVLGFSSRKVIGGRYRENMDFLGKILNKFGSFAIFAFALTPLPDDLVFIPLGATRYNPVKAFVPGIFGKFLLGLTVAYGGRFSIDIIGNTLGGGSDIVSVLISTVIGISVAIIMFKVDLTKCFGKHLIK